MPMTGLVAALTGFRNHAITASQLLEESGWLKVVWSMPVEGCMVQGSVQGSVALAMTLTARRKTEHSDERDEDQRVLAPLQGV